MKQMKIKWSDNFLLNNDTLDKDHKHLFFIVNVLIDHADDDNSSEIINETLYQLLEHIESHFENEERVMSLCDYPYLEDQKEMHRNFKHTIVMFCKDALNNKEALLRDLLIYLTGWVKQHISIEDQKIKDYLTYNKK